MPRYITPSYSQAVMACTTLLGYVTNSAGFLKMSVHYVITF